MNRYMLKSSIFLLLFTISHATLGSIRYVKYNAGGANNGTRWTNAYLSLQTALDAAQAGDEIWVASGTYKPTSGTDKTISFIIPSGVKVFGGLFGDELANYDLNLRSIETNATILSGDIGTQSDSTDNSYHAVKTTYVNAATDLDRFMIRNLNSNSGSFPYNRGGGWYNDGR